MLPGSGAAPGQGGAAGVPVAELSRRVPVNLGHRDFGTLLFPAFTTWIN